MNLAKAIRKIRTFFTALWGEKRTWFGLLSVEQMTGLQFPVVIRADDGAMHFCATADDVFNHFEPQDLIDSWFFGWDSSGRRFCFADWEEHGRVQVDDTATWDDFDRTRAAAYWASDEIASWREGTSVTRG